MGNNVAATPSPLWRGLLLCQGVGGVRSSRICRSGKTLCPLGVRRGVDDACSLWGCCPLALLASHCRLLQRWYGVGEVWCSGVLAVVVGLGGCLFRRCAGVTGIGVYGYLILDAASAISSIGRWSGRNGVSMTSRLRQQLRLAWLRQGGAAAVHHQHVGVEDDDSSLRTLLYYLSLLRGAL